VELSTASGARALQLGWTQRLPGAASGAGELVLENGPCHRRARATERKRGDKGEVGLQGGGCRGAGRSLSRCSSLGKKIGEREGKIWHTNANAWHAWPAPSSCQAKEIKRWCQVTRQIA
jgi:hypothetical protein